MEIANSIRNEVYEVNEYLEDHYNWHYYPHSYVSVTVFQNYPCTQTMVIVDGRTYYRCGSSYYDRVNHEGEVKYVEVSAPAGDEVKSLPEGYQTMKVSGETYYLSEDSFYKKIQRDGKPLYVVVDPPYGAELESLPEGAIQVSVNKKKYYQYDKVFYREIADPAGASYVIVAPPH